MSELAPVSRKEHSCVPRVKRKNEFQMPDQEGCTASRKHWEATSHSDEGNDMEKMAFLPRLSREDLYSFSTHTPSLKNKHPGEK